MLAFPFFILALINEDDDVLLSAYRRFEQRGGNPLLEQTLHQWVKIGLFAWNRKK